MRKSCRDERCKLDRLYLTADLLVLPRTADGLPITLTEAMAFGLPAVSTDVGGIPEIIQNRANRVVVPSDSSGDSFAEAIMRVADPHQYQALALNARRRFEQQLKKSAKN